MHASQYYPSCPLRWAADGHLVFYSEHEYWMHLYALSLKDKKLIPLTPGEFEVEDSFLSADGHTVLYNANAEDIDRRHIWSVPETGGNPIQLTVGKGLEWAPVFRSCTP